MQTRARRAILALPAFFAYTRRLSRASVLLRNAKGFGKSSRPPLQEPSWDWTLPGPPRADAHKGDYRMALYEHTVMTRQDISAQQAEALNDTIKALIEEGGGSVAKIEY